ncbi:MAG: NUDIX domain-containing protein [Planctomycetota bacterium]|nr:NUDIX domain-containing protein [Planctomycetota bacterium]
MFLFLSRLTPLVNVDLLISDEKQRFLLAWREDEYDGPGWHVPGGIIRFKESAAQRIRQVARLELGAEVGCDATPVAVHEHLRAERNTRGHFISLLYRCWLLTPPDQARQASSDRPSRGQWRWHGAWPQDIIDGQSGYQRYFDATGTAPRT